jgi:hypothetical protein
MTLRLSPLAALVLMACSAEGPADLPGQFGEDEDLVCVEASSEPVLDTDIVVLEADGAEVEVAGVLAIASGKFSATLTWLSTEEETLVTLDATAEPGTTEQVHYDPASADIPAENCPDRLRFALTGQLDTADGRLDEPLSTLAISDGPNIYIEARLDGIAGTLDPTALAVDGADVEPDKVDVNVLLQDSDLPFQGQVQPVLVASPDADVTPLGTWPGEVEEE